MRVQTIVILKGSLSGLALSRSPACALVRCRRERQCQVASLLALRVLSLCWWRCCCFNDRISPATWLEVMHTSLRLHRQQPRVHATRRFPTGEDPRFQDTTADCTGRLTTNKRFSVSDLVNLATITKRSSRIIQDCAQGVLAKL